MGLIGGSFKISTLICTFLVSAGAFAFAETQFRLESGNWELTLVYEKFELAGVSDADIKKHMQPTQVVSMCITDEMAKSPYFGLGSAMEGCTLDRKELSEGRFSASLICSHNGSVSTAAGTIAASTIDYVTTREQSGVQPSSMRARVTGRRMGPC